MNKKYWYFVAEINVNNEWVITYDGYVAHNDGFFPVNTAKLQSVDHGDIPPEEIPDGQDKKFFMKDTCIINQIEVSEREFEAWKVTMKF